MLQVFTNVGHCRWPHGLNSTWSSADHAPATALTEAKAAIARYQSFLSQDKSIAALDQNPFVPLAIQQTMTATLAALSASVH